MAEPLPPPVAWPYEGHYIARCECGEQIVFKPDQHVTAMAVAWIHKKDRHGDQ